MPVTAYQKTQQAFSNPRDTEYRLFAQITSGLIDSKDLPRHDERVIAAISRNRELWTTLASDCSAEENQLPASLRAQIISLSLWVNRYSSQVMRERADMGPLIDINRTIMEGLAIRAANAAGPAPAGTRSPVV